MQLELFAQATKSKIRYKINDEARKINGIFNVEDLWSLPLEVLNDTAVALNTELQAKQISFISTETTDKVAQLKFDVVKYIIDTKLQEQTDSKLAQENQVKKQRLLELKHQRQSEKFAQLSEEEIDKQLSELE
jgi:hypothetical protein